MRQQIIKPLHIRSKIEFVSFSNYQKPDFYSLVRVFGSDTIWRKWGPSSGRVERGLIYITDQQIKAQKTNRTKLLQQGKKFQKQIARPGLLPLLLETEFDCSDHLRKDLA
jgi:hypothetical protein